MPYDARVIANFFLTRAGAEQIPLTPMTLLKILYFAHAWHLARFGSPLVGQPFEAWKHGPVVRVVYEQLKSYGQKPISSLLKKIDPERGEFVDAVDEIEEDKEKFLRDLFDYYCKFDAYTLSDLTHERGGPWENVWKIAESRAVPGMEIPNRSIKEWFERTGERRRAEHS